MSTLTWITEEELERKVKKQGDQFRWKKNITILYITTVRKREKVSGHQSEKKTTAMKCTKKVCLFIYLFIDSYNVQGREQ